MRSGRKAPVAGSTWREDGLLDALPPSARALFGADFFSTLAWYQTVLDTGLPLGARPVFVTVEVGDAVVAVFPMQVTAGIAAALTTPYTCLWQPLLAPDLDARWRGAMWQGFVSWCRRFATVRLDAMDADMAAGLAAALRRSLVPLPFRHFGNWHQDGIDGWDTYWASRPGQLREAVRRRGRRFASDAFELLCEPMQVDRAVEAYENVYYRSWKTAEPFPAFNPALIRACAQDGSLRLGVLRLDGKPVAVQIWVVRGAWAAVLKLAHDEAAKPLSPGTLLTARMIEHLLTRDGVTSLDFGRGDDDYKAGWTGERRQRMGLILANARHPAGLAEAARYGIAKGARTLRRWTGRSRFS